MFYSRGYISMYDSYKQYSQYPFVNYNKIVVIFLMLMILQFTLYTITTYTSAHICPWVVHERLHANNWHKVLSHVFLTNMHFRGWKHWGNSWNGPIALPTPNIHTKGRKCPNWGCQEAGCNVDFYLCCILSRWGNGACGASIVLFTCCRWEITVVLCHVLDDLCPERSMLRLGSS